MKKTLFLLSILLCMSCNNITEDSNNEEQAIKYQLTIDNEKGYATYLPEQTFFEEGEEIIIKTKIIPNFNLKLFINDQFYSYQTYMYDYEDFVWQFSFKMPNQDATIHFEKEEIEATSDIYLKDVTKHVPKDEFFILSYLDNSHFLHESLIKKYIETYNLMLNTKVIEINTTKDEFQYNHKLSFNCYDDVYNFSYKYVTYYHDGNVYVSLTNKENMHYVNHYYKLVDPSEKIVLSIKKMINWGFVTESNIINSDYDCLNQESFKEMFFEYDSDKTKRPSGFMLEDHIYQYNKIIESNSSVLDAISTIIEEYATQQSYTKISHPKLIESNELYYGFYVKESYEYVEYDKYIISFKEDVYDYENSTFYTNDITKIKTILDICFYAANNVSRSYLYHSELTNINDKYCYIIYYNTFSYGDSWGEVPSSIKYYRRLIEFNDDFTINDYYDQLILKTGLPYGV